MPMIGVISGVVTPKDKIMSNPLARLKVRMFSKLIFQVANQKPAVFVFTDVYKKFRDICEEEQRLLDSNLKY